METLMAFLLVGLGAAAGLFASAAWRWCAARVENVLRDIDDQDWMDL